MEGSVMGAMKNWMMDIEDMCNDLHGREWAQDDILLWVKHSFQSNEAENHARRFLTEQNGEQ